MALKVYKPYTPSRRSMTGHSFEEITKNTPEKSLVKPMHKTAGRNARGKVTVRHRGGGEKRMFRVIDFRRDKLGVPGKVAAIEYDPNRTARIALIHYVDGDKRYILAPLDLNVGDSIQAGEGSEPKPGNAMPLAAIPVGTLVHNVELQLGRGGQLVRSAGGSAQIMGKEGDYTQLRLPSGEMRRILSACTATVGQLGNVDHQNVVIGKAGRRRHMGWRSAVRGVAMSPRHHPHGGGEGRSPIGMPGPKTPWGKPALGYKTRKRNKPSNSFIVKHRK